MITSSATDRLRDVARAVVRPHLALRRRAKIEHLVIVPPDLRTPDPGFLGEARDGRFALDGMVAESSDGGAFDVRSAPEAWLKALHGFGWLRHLDAAGTVEAEDFARELIDTWLASAHTNAHVRHAPDVLARRVLSWLAHAGLILDAANRARYDAAMQALAGDISRLDHTWRKAPAGDGKLTAAIARVQSRLSTGASDARRQRAERDLARELDAQIMADGSHISRDADVLVRLMFDLLPLRQCYQARQILVPVPLFSAMSRIVPFLRFMRLGDGSLARFNGGGHAAADELATVIGYDAANAPAPLDAARSGYVRCTAGATIVVADVGGPPPPGHAGRAHGGCLAFEMSDGRFRVFSNPGRRRGGDMAATVSARATAQHSTLCIEGASSATMAHGGAQNAQLHMPGAVFAGPSPPGGLSFAAVHAGYAGRFGFDHTRRLTLTPDGARLDGADVLVPVARRTHERRGFAVHFHVDPSVGVRRGDRPGEVLLTLPDGAQWTFIANADLLAIEESVSPGHARAPGLQIVLRGAHDGASGPLAIDWTIERLT